MDDSAIICDEFIDAYTDGKANLNAETNFNEKCNLQNAKFLYLTCIFINYNSIIDSC